MKIKMGQELKGLNGEPLRLGGPAGLDARTLNAVISEVINKADLPQAQRDTVLKLLEELAGKPILLCNAVCDALMGAYEDERSLPGSERSKRIALALRLNRTGMAKISDADVKYIVPLVEKTYRGSLVSPQVDALLQGKDFKAGLADGDEEDDALASAAGEAAPTA